MGDISKGVAIGQHSLARPKQFMKNMSARMHPYHHERTTEMENNITVKSSFNEILTDQLGIDVS
jgi:hypothetical protein